jgi:hypothetical protein
MSFWVNVFLGKCPSGQMSFWANVNLGKCFLGKCISGQMYFWANVAGQMSPGKFRITLFYNPNVMKVEDAILQYNYNAVGGCHFTILLSCSWAVLFYNLIVMQLGDTILQS